MPLLAKMNCMIGRHQPQRRNVEWTGNGYVGECKHCGKAIRRIRHKNWRLREV